MTTRRDLLKISTGLAAGGMLGARAGSALAGAHTTPSAKKSRQVVSLDGMWEVGESVSATQAPTVYDRRSPVPGLTHSAVPPFPDVDRYDSRELEFCKTLLRLPYDANVIAQGGVSRQKRNYFWYRTYFTAPQRHSVGTLKINKAQFGSETWLNGVRVGAENSCFTASTYDITKAVKWADRNELIIRIGAHPGVLPPGNVCNTDFEKARWTPGIWDSVSAWFDDGPSIIRQQVAPRIATGEIIVQTVVRNVTASPHTFTLRHAVTSKDESTVIADSESRLTLSGHEERTVLERIRIPNVALWSPESPHLYQLKTSTPGDDVTTRFGMREFRFDTATKRAYLNGKVIFLRGSNVALHRFFEDPESGQLPWTEPWVRKLLGENPRRMHWNMLKFTIGPVPQFWLDVADEEGVLVLYEFPVWVLSKQLLPNYSKTFDPPVMRREYERFLQDNWNHPSIAYWNASEESVLPQELSGDMIEAVRKLDLSERAWGNAWNPTVGAEDPVEEHPYKFVPASFGSPPFDMVQLETDTGMPNSRPIAPSGHATIITEYDWLWLRRDGSIPYWTAPVYPSLPYPHATVSERFETQAYLLAGLTEYWRAYRNCAGVIYFAYLGSGAPDSWTCDNFADVRELTFNSHYEHYVPEAFKPLGVYINFWQRAMPSGKQQRFDVMMVNDGEDPNTGELVLRLQSASGETLAEVRERYFLGENGQTTLSMVLDIPRHGGACRLEARATPSNLRGGESTVSRRWVQLLGQEPSSEHPIPKSG